MNFAIEDISAMHAALSLAWEAFSCGEVPVGALVVRNNQIVSQGYNLKETFQDPTAHAERIALTLAGKALRSWRLDDCVLYVTLEPCVMCAGAIVQSRIQRVVYGAKDPKAGACDSLYRILADPRLNHQVALVSGVLEADCREILSQFFQQRRRRSQTLSEGCLSG